MESPPVTYTYYQSYFNSINVDNMNLMKFSERSDIRAFILDRLIILSDRPLS